MKKCCYSGKATAFSEVVWSMERKSAGGPNRDQREYGPWREKEQVDQIVFRGSMVLGEKRLNGPNLRYKD